jgi:plastocyanin
VTALVFLDGSRAGEHVEVEGEIVVGRTQGDLTLEDAEVSRRHAILRPAAGGMEVEDLISTNGTWINGSRIAGVGLLRWGDTLQIGGTRLRLQPDAGVTVIRDVPPAVRRETALTAPPPAASEPPAVASKPPAARGAPPGPVAPPAPVRASPPALRTPNSSGQGKDAVVPPEVRRWNWGAFFLTWIWGIGNRTYRALLTLIPPLFLVMPFVLGANGNDWAWRARPWDSIEHFRRVQRRWALWGLVAAVLVAGAGSVVTVVLLRGGAVPNVSTLPKGFVLHRDPRAGYEIALPDDAEIQGAKAGLALDAVLGSAAPHTELQIESIQSPDSLDAEGQRLQHTLEARKDVTGVSKADVQFQSVQAVEVDFKVQGENGSKDSALIVVGDGKGFVLKFITTQAFNAPTKTIRTMMRTFAFIPGDASAPGGSPPSGTALGMANYAFTPSSLSAVSGSTIVVTNHGSVVHNLTIGTDVNVDVQPGTTTTVRIDLKSGTYHFFCKYHQSLGMTGSIDVS